jgi:hypothetical protein
MLGEVLVAQILWEVRARVLARGSIKELSKHVSCISLKFAILVMIGC